MKRKKPRLSIKKFLLPIRRPKYIKATKDSANISQSFFQSIVKNSNATARRDISNFRSQVSGMLSESFFGSNFFKSSFNNFFKNYMALEPKKKDLFTLSRNQMASEMMKELNKGKKNL